MLYCRNVVPRVLVGSVFIIPRPLCRQRNSVLSTAKSQDWSIYSSWNPSNGRHLAYHCWRYHQYVFLVFCCLFHLCHVLSNCSGSISPRYFHESSLILNIFEKNGFASFGYIVFLYVCGVKWSNTQVNSARPSS